ncbi:MAG: (2Fe-2S)-binding protein [Pseudomonadota bacterium]
MITLNINGERKTVEADPDTPLLWVLREQLALTGTKFGCGIAQCGACTVLIGNIAARACSIPLSNVNGRELTTIEGLATDADTPHPLQEAWIEQQTPQCGYCQSGQLMAAAALLRRNPNPTDEDINRAMEGNICRCGMYGRIRTAIKMAAGRMAEAASLPLATEEVTDG